MKYKKNYEKKDATPKELAQIIIDEKIYIRYNGMDNGGWTCHVSSNHQRYPSEMIVAQTIQIWGTRNEHRELENLLKKHMKVFPREYENEEQICDDCGFCMNDEDFCKWDSHINTEYVLKTWKNKIKEE